MTISTHRVKDVLVLGIEGELKRSGNAEISLLQQVKAQIENGERKLLIDLAKAEFIDSFGVGEILASYVTVRNSGGKLKVALGRWLSRVIGIPNPIPDLSYASREATLEDFESPGHAKKT